jgi:phage-related protein
MAGARIIGTAAVKVTSDTTGFSTSTGASIKKDLEKSLTGDELKPGLNKNKNNLSAFAKQAGAIFTGLWAAVRASAITELVAIAPQLANALLPVVGVVGLIPGVFAAAGGAMATLVVGMKGFGKALTDVGNTKKFAADLKNLAPNAAATAIAFQKMQPALKGLRLDVQNTLFEGMAGELKSLGVQVLPIVRTGMDGFAASLNRAGHFFAQFFQQAGTKADLAAVFNSGQAAVFNLSNAIRPLLSIFQNLTVVAAGSFADITANAGRATQKLADFVQRARDSGQLAQFIQQGVVAFKQLLTVVVNVGSIVITILQGLGSQGGNFLSVLGSLTGQMAAFLRSAQGQAALQAIGAAMAAIGNNLGPVLLKLLQVLASTLVNLSPFVVTLANALGVLLVGAITAVSPLLNGLTTLMGQHATATTVLTGITVGLIGAFKLFSILKTVAEFFTIARTALLGFSIAEVVATVAGSALEVVIAILTAPITLIVAAIVAAIAVVGVAVFLLIKNWKSVLGFLTDVWRAILAVARAVWSSIAGFFTDLWNAITGAIVGAWNSIASFFTGLWNTITGAIRSAWDTVARVLTEIWQKIVAATRPIWEPIVHILGDIIAIIKDLFIIVFGGIAIIAIAVWNAIKDGTIAAWNVILGVLKAVWAGILIVFHAVWDPLVIGFKIIWDAVTAAVQIVWGAILGFLGAVWAGILAIFHAVWDPIVALFSSIWAGVKEVVTAVWNVISGFLSSVWNGIVGQVRAVFGPIVGFFRDVWNNVSNAVSDGIGHVISFVGGIGGKILRALGDVGSILLNAGKAIIEGFLHGLESAFDAVKNFFGGIANWIQAHKGPLEFDRQLLVPHGNAVLEGFLHGLKQQMGPLESFLAGVSDTVAGAFGGDVGAQVNLAGLGATSAAQGGASSPIIVHQTNQMLPGTDPFQFAAQSAAAMGRALGAGGSRVVATSPQAARLGMTNKTLAAGSLV